MLPKHIRLVLIGIDFLICFYLIGARAAHSPAIAPPAFRAIQRKIVCKSVLYTYVRVNNSIGKLLFMAIVPLLSRPRFAQNSSQIYDNLPLYTFFVATKYTVDCILLSWKRLIKVNCCSWLCVKSPRLETKTGRGRRIVPL